MRRVELLIPVCLVILMTVMYLIVRSMDVTPWHPCQNPENHLTMVCPMERTR